MASGNLIGRILYGKKAMYEIIAPAPGNAFKALVLSPRQSSPTIQLNIPKKHVAIKEYFSHDVTPSFSSPEIKSSPYIQQLEDVGIHECFCKKEENTSRYLVLEWMDTDLTRVGTKGLYQAPKLFRVVAKAVLEALNMLHASGWKVDDRMFCNILLSDINSEQPKAKLSVGDLVHRYYSKGNDNYCHRAVEPVAIRAPEVWLEKGPSHKSDIWVLGYYLIDWLTGRNPFNVPLVGSAYTEGIEVSEVEALAYLTQLCGPLPFPDPGSSMHSLILKAMDYQHSYRVNRTEPDRWRWNEAAIVPNVPNLTLRDKLETISKDVCSDSCIDFIESLMVIDHDERPTAKEALTHPFLADIKS